MYCLPYSDKLSREKTFVIWQKWDFCGENFRGLLAGVAAKDATPPNFAEKTFYKTLKFMKVFSLESFPLYSITDSNREASSVSGEDDSSYCGALLKDAIKNDDDEDDDETLLQSRPFSTDSWVFGLHWLCIPEQEHIRTAASVRACNSNRSL